MSDLLGALTTVGLGLLASLQWYLSHQQQRRRRDAELLRWGGEVIMLMAELEGVCAPIRDDAPPLDRSRAEKIAIAASALVDRGRLFFSNIGHDRSPATSSRLRAFSGYRPAILDEVLRAHYVARSLAGPGARDGQLLRQHVWSARGRFVTCLQTEMGPALKRSPDHEIGEEIDYDPGTWRVELDREHMDPSTRR